MGCGARQEAAPTSEWGLNNNYGSPPKITWGLCQAPVKWVLGPFILILRTASPEGIAPLSCDFTEFRGKVSVGKDVNDAHRPYRFPKGTLGFPQTPSSRGFRNRLHGAFSPAHLLTKAADIILAKPGYLFIFNHVRKKSQGWHTTELWTPKPPGRTFRGRVVETRTHR